MFFLIQKDCSRVLSPFRLSVVQIGWFAMQLLCLSENVLGHTIVLYPLQVFNLLVTVLLPACAGL